MFQCSSASRKFLNRHERGECDRSACVSVLFSEPKIPQRRDQAIEEDCCGMFQCSSASRKFLNKSLLDRIVDESKVSVLFSEPKIPQLRFFDFITSTLTGFSALQRAENSSTVTMPRSSTTMSTFQCSSASRKFLNRSWRPPRC